MTNGLWWRYYTTPHNYSRTRAWHLQIYFYAKISSQTNQIFRPSLLERDALNDVIQSDENLYWLP